MSEKPEEPSSSLTRRKMLANVAQGAAIASISPVLSVAAKPAPEPIQIDTDHFSVTVDPARCRWSTRVKASMMALNNVHFLPNDDPSGWTVVSSVNKDDHNKFGSFVTVALHGSKPGELDFEYRISAAKAGADILVSLARTNKTGKPVDLQDMDYFVCSDARLGGTTDKWISLGTHSSNRDYYELLAVQEMVTPKMYEVNHVVRDADTGNCLLMGHATALKGASRFEVWQGWQGTANDRMKIRGYCSYKVTMPAGASFAGEQLLINLSHDGLRAMEHQAELISIGHDVRLKQRRPIDPDDEDLVANTYSRFHGWMSGGSKDTAKKFFDEHGLGAFWLGGVSNSGPRQASFGLYGCGGGVRARPSRVNYAPECYLPVRTPKYNGERVIDFSNPLTVSLERERAEQWAADDPQHTGAAEMDFADFWDKWPGQFDPYMSSLETYRACGLIWRDAIDKTAPRRTIRSNMNAVDHSYGIVDICRISEDADRGYEALPSSLLSATQPCLFSETVLGSANRFFYNGRVFWNDGDGFHVYKYVEPDGKDFDERQAKVVANFRAIANNTILVSEAFDAPYPEDRIELLKRISPPTMDVSYPVDLFIRQPAQVWNLPVERPFGKWNVVGVFNYTRQLKILSLGNSLILRQDGGDDAPFTTTLDAAKDLRLDPDKEYVVYEFWSKAYLGTFRGSFTTRPVKPYDCDVYCIVEKPDHPAVISTSRHVRQMAFDIKHVGYDGSRRALKGTSRAVPGDPYELRIYLPNGFDAKRVELANGLSAEMKAEGNLLTVSFTSSNANDVNWELFF
jgi:hypothetical protein